MTATVQVNDTGSTVSITVTEGSVQIGTPTSTAHNSLALRSAADAHPASAITNTPAGGIAATTVQAAIDELDADKQINPSVVAGNFTAVNNGAYIAIATLTVTDPTPSVGANYIVHIRNGAATIGGVAYAAGQDVHRVWHSGSWTSTPMPSRAATVTASRLTEFDASGNLQNSAVQDGVTGGVATLAATLTTNRTYTFPDAAITVAGSASALTSGRVPYVTTGGLLTDANSFTFAAGVVTLGAGTGTPGLAVDGAAGGFRYLGVLRSAGLDRWQVVADNSAESGSNAGSAFAIRASTDAGALIDTPLSIVRAAGGAITLARPVTSTGVVTVPNGTAAAPGIRLTSEASGLYRRSATSTGIATAGAAALGVIAPTTGFGGALVLETPVSGDVSYIISGSNTASVILSGASTTTAGGQIRVYGSTHATKANFVEITSGATVRATVNGSGDLSISSTTASTSTSSGALVVSGGVGVAGAIYAGSTISTSASVIGASLVSATGRSAIVTNDSSCWFYRTDGTGSGDFASAGHMIIQPRTTTGSARDVIFCTGNTTPTEQFRIDSNGNKVCNAAALATNATNGFLYVPSCAGTPTGVPTSKTGTVPIVVDTTNNKLYFYSGGAWRDAGP